MAKLLVPLGAPDQSSAGEIFLPVQSQPLNTCSSAILAPGLTSGLVKVSALAAPALANPPSTTAVIKENSRITQLLPQTPTIAPSLVGTACRRRHYRSSGFDFASPRAS